jgi:hypothetical protein
MAGKYANDSKNVTDVSKMLELEKTRIELLDKIVKRANKREG